MSLYDIEITAGTDATTVRLGGEVDMAAVGHIENELAATLEAGVDVLVLDLSRVTFFDSSGLRLVLRLDRHQRELGRRLVVVPGSRRVARVFELTGVDKQLEFAAEGELPDPG
jgi:anti-anti-sigma factor